MQLLQDWCCCINPNRSLGLCLMTDSGLLLSASGYSFITIARPSGDTPICTFCSSSAGSTPSTFFFFFPAIFSTIQ